jgi:hypothetical protein
VIVATAATALIKNKNGYKRWSNQTIEHWLAVKGLAMPHSFGFSYPQVMLR